MGFPSKSMTDIVTAPRFPKRQFYSQGLSSFTKFELHLTSGHSDKRSYCLISGAPCPFISPLLCKWDHHLSLFKGNAKAELASAPMERIRQDGKQQTNKVPISSSDQRDVCTTVSSAQPGAAKIKPIFGGPLHPLEKLFCHLMYVQEG